MASASGWIEAVVTGAIPETLAGTHVAVAFDGRDLHSVAVRVGDGTIRYRSARTTLGPARPHSFAYATHLGPNPLVLVDGLPPCHWIETGFTEAPLLNEPTVAHAVPAAESGGGLGLLVSVEHGHLDAVVLTADSRITERTRIPVPAQPVVTAWGLSSEHVVVPSASPHRDPSAGVIWNPDSPARFTVARRGAARHRHFEIGSGFVARIVRVVDREGRLIVDAVRDARPPFLGNVDPAPTASGFYRFSLDLHTGRATERLLAGGIYGDACFTHPPRHRSVFTLRHPDPRRPEPALMRLALERGDRAERDLGTPLLGLAFAPKPQSRRGLDGWLLAFTSTEKGNAAMWSVIDPESLETIARAPVGSVGANSSGAWIPLPHSNAGRSASTQLVSRG